MKYSISPRIVIAFFAVLLMAGCATKTPMDYSVGILGDRDR